MPEDVRRFLIANIDSVSELEALLLLREHKGQRWTIHDAGSALYTPPESAELYLEHLHENRLLDRFDDEEDRSYEYAPETHQLEDVVTKLAETYQTRRHLVVKTIMSGPSDQVQSFADAFKIRKED